MASVQMGKQKNSVTRDPRICRFRFRSEQFEVEYEGAESFALEHALPTLESLINAQFRKDSEGGARIVGAASPDRATSVSEGPHPTTREIATKLGLDDSHSLVLAACGHLTIARHQAAYSREEILEQMRLVPDCVEFAMVHVLDKTLRDLTKNGRLEKKDEGYALTEKMTQALTQRLQWED